MKQIIPLQAFKDNYIWMMVVGQKAWVVDPGDAQPVITALEKMNLSLAGILLTHHHADHSGGIAALLAYVGEVPVIGSAKSVVAQVNQPVCQDDEIDYGEMCFKVIEIPGHTLDHTAFYEGNKLFCGDTLFSAGCGRVFEGTPAMMYDSLNKIMALPDATEIYCGHEYTLANLAFAHCVEPNNSVITKKREAVQKLRDKGVCTLPSLLSEEKQINPFLRCHVPSVHSAAENYAGKKLESVVDVFAYLREWKNNF